MKGYFYVITDGVCTAHIHGSKLKRPLKDGWRVIGVYKA